MSGPVDPTRAEKLAQLQAAVASLRRLDREIFLAHRVEAMSYDEIAAMTGLSHRQVKRRMLRALLGIDRFMRGKRRPWWRRWMR